MKRLVMIAVVYCGVVHASEVQKPPSPPLTAQQVIKGIAALQLSVPAESNGSPSPDLFSPRYTMVLAKRADYVAQCIAEADPSTAQEIQEAAASSHHRNPSPVLRAIRERFGDLSMHYSDVLQMSRERKQSSGNYPAGYHD